MDHLVAILLCTHYKCDGIATFCSFFIMYVLFSDSFPSEIDGQYGSSAVVYRIPVILLPCAVLSHNLLGSQSLLCHRWCYCLQLIVSCYVYLYCLHSSVVQLVGLFLNDLLLNLQTSIAFKFLVFLSWNGSFETQLQSSCYVFLSCQTQSGSQWCVLCISSVGVHCCGTASDSTPVVIWLFSCVKFCLREIVGMSHRCGKTQSQSVTLCFLISLV